MLNIIKRFTKELALVSWIFSWLRARKSVKWYEIYKNSSPINEQMTEHKVLMATSLGDYEMGILLESTLATALKLRNSSVDILLCDHSLTACQMAKIESIDPKEMHKRGPKSRCSGCFNYGKAILRGSNVNQLYYSSYLNNEDKEIAIEISKNISINEIKTFIYDEIKVGEHAYAGALRYFARGDLENEEYGSQILRKYLESAILTVKALENLLKKKDYDVVCFHHGIYVPQGLITQVCKKNGLRIVTWNPAYKKNTFVFSHDDTYHHTMISEDASRWNSIDLDESKEKEITDYLLSRRSGTEDWIWFHDHPEENLQSIKKELGSNLENPAIGLFTNVMWDAQLHYESNAFENMMEWVFTSIDYFSERSDLDLFIRIHPAEMRGAIPSRQPLLEEINKKYPVLPGNIFVIPPESQISTYAVMDFCNAVTIYNTKTGIEVASEGIPIIVAGEAWIRNKGFSVDVESKEEYLKVLDSLPFSEKMNQSSILLAKRYAYHFFMRRMIPIPFIEYDPLTKIYSSKLNSIEELSEGNYKGLDVICDGVLYGRPFEFDNEI